METQAMEAACAGRNKRTFTFRKGKPELIQVGFKKQTEITGVSGSISSNKKVHQQCKKRRQIQRSC